MIITAVYLYGISQHAWGFSWWYGFLAFIMDIIFVILIAPSIRIWNRISDEEKDYWKKRWEVEELNRIKLNRELYGGKR